MSKKFWIILSAALILLGIFAFFRFTGGGTALLWKISNGGTALLPLVLVASLLDSINPCAFSILILTIAFLLSIGQIRARVLAIGGFYIAGIFAAYLLIGLGLLQALHLFNTPHFMSKVGAILLIALGTINLINEFFPASPAGGPAFPIKLRIPGAAHRAMAGLMRQTSLVSAFALGALVGLCEFPCTGGPYLMVLGLLHDSATYGKGLGYLVLYNLIFILPLVIILVLASEKSLTAKVEAWQKKERVNMRLWGGAAMIIFGLLILW